MGNPPPPPPPPPHTHTPPHPPPHNPPPPTHPHHNHPTHAPQLAHAAGVPVVLDAGGASQPLPPELLRCLAVVSPNETELQGLTGGWRL